MCQIVESYESVRLLFPLINADFQVTCSGLPAGTICLFNAPLFSGSNYFQLHTQSAASGTYNFTITGTSDGLVHTTSAQLFVTSGTFAGSASPLTATIAVGHSQNLTVTVNSTGGFQGIVNLACSAAPGITCQLLPAQVTLTSGGTATSTLSIGVAARPAILPWNLRRIFETWRFSPFLMRVALLIALITALLCFGTFGRRPAGARAFALLRSAVFLSFLALVLGITSCGGGGSISTVGGGGGGGGTPTITTVSVQSTVGGTTVNLGSVTVTIP